MSYRSYVTSVTSSSGRVSKYQSGWKMVPFSRKQILPTDYYLVVSQVTNYNGTSAAPVSSSYWSELQADPSTATNRAYSSAYRKFKDLALGSSASVMTALAERQETFDMIAHRCIQLKQGYDYLKKGQLGKFMNHFGVAPKPKHRKKRWSRPKDAAGLWLEYWMGWAPTMGDIYACMENLGKVIAPTTFKTGASAPFQKKGTSYTGSTSATTVIEGKVRVRIQGSVLITNPSLFQLQALGLANPLLTAWEVIPFSWLVGWFVNAESIFSQVTDWLGCSIVGLEIGYKTTYTKTYLCQNWNPGISSTGPKNLVCDRSVVIYNRTHPNSFPTIKPVWRVPNGLSYSRGATAISLLVQSLRSK